MSSSQAFTNLMTEVVSPYGAAPGVFNKVSMYAYIYGCMGVSVHVRNAVNFCICLQKVVMYRQIVVHGRVFYECTIYMRAKCCLGAQNVVTGARNVVDMCVV